MERIDFEDLDPDSARVLNVLREGAKSAATQLVSKHATVSNMARWGMIQKMAEEAIKMSTPTLGAEWIERIPWLGNRERAAQVSGDTSFLTADLSLVAATNLYYLLLGDVMDVLARPFRGERIVLIRLRGREMKIDRITHPLEMDWNHNPALATFML